MYPNNHFSRNPAAPPQPRQQIFSPFQNPNFPHANTPPSQQQQQPQPLNNFAFQTPSFSHAGTPPQQQQQQQQQPLNNFAFRSPNFPYAATPPPQHQQQQQQPLNNFAFQNHNFPYAATPQQQQQPSASQNPNLNNTPFQRPQQSMHGGGGDLRERVERMVAATRREVAGKGECVSAWNVVQIVLKSLNVESWSDMGFPMQEVPSLHRLIVLEGKINAFIYCYVGTQRITSLHDLEVAICKDEGVEHFKDLEMGPLLKHPLVLHYFGVSSDITEVFKITATEIISLLSEFMECSKKKDVKAEDFLSFIAMRRSVASQDNLGVRIQSLGMHIHFIREAKKSEGTCLDILKQKSGKSNSSRKRPLLCSAKRKLDERFAIISKYVKSFPMENSDSGENCESLIDEDDEIDGDDQSQCKPSLNISSGFERVSNCPYPSATEEKKRLGHKFRNSPPRVGKHIRFDSSSSEDEDTNANTCRDKKSDTTECSYKLSLKNNKVYDRASSCPYPSVFEEMTRVGLGSDANHAGHQPVCIGVKESSKKKRKFNLQNLSTSRPSKFLKREKVSKEVHTRDNHQGTEADIELDVADFTFSDKDAMLFIGTWKDSCQKHNAAEILSRMLQFYNVSSRQRKKAKSMFSTYPFIGLLNIAVDSIMANEWNCFKTLPPFSTECSGLIPGLTDGSWNDTEEVAFLFGMYAFKKNFPEIRNFVKTKSMGQVLCYYYVKFRMSNLYNHWKECHKKNSDNCLYGQKIFSVCVRRKFVNCLLLRVPEECKDNITKIFESFRDKKITLDEYVIALISAVGMSVFIETAEIGKEYPGSSGRSNKVRYYPKISRKYPHIGDDYQAEIPPL